MARRILLMAVLLSTGTSALAQSGPPCAALLGVCLPNELEVGAGVLHDQVARTAPAVLVLGASFVNGTWPLDIALEGDLGATAANAPECRLEQDTPNCFDASLLVGPRFRLRRGNPQRRIFPFVSTLIGAYWKGSGVEHGSSASAHLAVQVGGGLDVHWPESLHGLRVMVDYRRVAAYGRHEPGLDQTRFVVAYVLNERAVSPQPRPRTAGLLNASRARARRT